jgi:predicted RNA-binding Zn-ribbon protein involved in translation (DUF1610 family)
MLNCPGCSAALTATEVLEACSVWVPGSGLLRLRCPHCGQEAFARLDNGQLEVGSAASEAGGAFRPHTSAQEPDLYVRRDESWFDCWFGKVYRRFPVGT